MKSFFKLPLYLGLAVLVVAVLISAIKIGNQQAFTSQRTRASVAGGSLILKYTSPDLVSVLLTSDKSVSGVDVTLKFNNEVTVLPSSLSGGADFVTSGGDVDSQGYIFTFSAVAKKPAVTAGVVASFTVSPKSGNSANADLQFDQKGSSVIDKATGQNILSQTQGVKFTVSKK